MVAPDSTTGKSLPTDTALPLARIRTIMKSSLDTGQITNEVLFLMAKATEMFIQHVTKESITKVDKGNTLKYEHLAKFAQSRESLEFLLQIIPQKIKVKEFREILKKKDDQDSDDSD
ncbi:chromatin accessibility complex 16kD protein-like [Teleopsis dalmanni]|uniref:chromatin accessibility complex 16kD protein-like n=1 Tax=Teleopsis dalmanni TaxID=139649 RepID=UPI0018CD7E2E|nr:chromatin accessibility complex 16kD protein-like [Teleopsis dalmanni]